MIDVFLGSDKYDNVQDFFYEKNEFRGACFRAWKDEPED